jgi:predicted MPP superfamily phosphohydrolase
MLNRRTFLRGAGAAIALGVGVGLYTVIIEPGFRLQVKEWGVAHPSWPATMPSLRIAVLTDIHAVEPWMPASRIGHIVDTTQGLDADIIVLLGDFVEAIGRKLRTGTVPISAWAPELGRLRAPLGVHAVLGNHDWYDDEAAVRAGLKQVGINVLENRAIKLERGRRRFWLAGLGDQLARPYGWHVQRGADDLPGTLKQVSGDNDPVVMLVHEPDIFVKIPKRVTVTLAGHTHGGQVQLPLIGRPIVPSAYGQRFAYGHIVENGRNLIVSSGLGLTGIPVRFGVPPEIALVTVGAPGFVDASV